LDIQGLIADKETLIQSLKEHYQKDTQALIKEFNYQEKGKIIKYQERSTAFISV
jgi:hypothetical protein